jgi:hypothetical protein
MTSRVCANSRPYVPLPRSKPRNDTCRNYGKRLIRCGNRYEPISIMDTLPVYLDSIWEEAKSTANLIHTAP